MPELSWGRCQGLGAKAQLAGVLKRSEGALRGGEAEQRRRAGPAYARVQRWAKWWVGIKSCGQLQRVNSPEGEVARPAPMGAVS